MALRVLIVSADIGEGHDLPARMLAADLRARRPDAEVRIIDGLREMGPVLRFAMRTGAEVILGRLTWLFEAQHFLAVRFPPTRKVAKELLHLLGSRGLLRAVREHRPDVIVSTYPGTTEVLGWLRGRGRIGVPVVSAITDLAALRHWAHPDVDLHLLTHEESVEEVRALAGPVPTGCVRGLTGPEFDLPRDPVAARRALGLPAEGKLVVVSGGGWGVGKLEDAARAVLSAGAPTVVCLCGRNEALRARLERDFGCEPRVRVMGFTDRMADLLAAADVLVHSTAGLTVLEAIVQGTTTISYGWGVAHLRANNRAYARFGLARVAASRADLVQELEWALANPARPDTSYGARPSAAELVAGLT
ncbi:MAG: glycosyltransferase, partial [Actinomycetota bacterium]|nr:glycosyltransferase [Actinomycetota bacterium]